MYTCRPTLHHELMPLASKGQRCRLCRCAGGHATPKSPPKSPRYLYHAHKVTYQHLCCAQGSQKSPAPPVKEPYITHKRALYHPHKSPISPLESDLGIYGCPCTRPLWSGGLTRTSTPTITITTTRPGPWLLNMTFASPSLLLLLLLLPLLGRN